MTEFTMRASQSYCQRQTYNVYENKSFRKTREKKQQTNKAFVKFFNFKTREKALTDGFKKRDW